MAHSVYEVGFKQMIVGLLESGMPAREVSTDYSLNEGMIRRWRRGFKQRNGDFTKPKPPSPMELELKALKKELKDVTLERDIFKKAVVQRVNWPIAFAMSSPRATVKVPFHIWEQ